MSWAEDRDIIFCAEILASKLFATKKSSAERGKVWESIADKLNELRQPSFRVDQSSVRDHYKKLVDRYKRKVREELNSSGISPEPSELDSMLEEIVEKEENAAAEKENIDGENQRRMEADRMAADDIRRQAMETQSETLKRKSAEGDQCAKKKRRRNVDQTVAYLQEKAQMEMQMRREEMDLKKVEIYLKCERQKQQREQQDNLMAQQGNMIKVMMDQHQHQQQQIQAMQMMMMIQQQQQQNQALMALLEKLSK